MLKISSCGTCSAPFTGSLNCYESAVRPGHRSLDYDEIPLGVHLEHRKPLHRHPFVTQMSGHALSFPDPRRICRGAYTARSPVRHASVRSRLAAEVVPFHDAGKPLTFAGPDDIHDLAFFEHVGLDFVAGIILITPRGEFGNVP